MLRTIVGVVLGYVTMVVWVMLTFTVAWVLTGASFAFQPGTTEVTPGWIVVALVLSLLGALLGGYVAGKIGRGRGAVIGLMGLVVVLGLALAVAHLFMDAPPPVADASTLSATEAANSAIQPVWYNFAIPFLGAFGVWLGGRSAGKSRRSLLATA